MYASSIITDAPDVLMTDRIIRSITARSRMLPINCSADLAIGRWKRSRRSSMISILGYFAKVIILQILIMFLIFALIVTVYIIKCVIDEMGK